MSETTIEQARFLSQIAAAYYDDEDNDEFRDDFAKDILAALRTARSEADAELGVLREALLAQHHHRLQRGDIGIQDGKGGWVAIDEGVEYSESRLFEQTVAALSASPRAAAVMDALKALRDIRDIEKPMCGDQPETDWLQWYTTSSQQSEIAEDALAALGEG